MSETSPTPWRLQSDCRYVIEVADAPRKVFCEHEDDAGTILSAVNCHAEMVEALKGIDRMLTQAYGDIGDNAVAERVGELAAAPWRSVRSVLARATQTNTGE